MSVNDHSSSQWFYLDVNDTCQGPFDHSTMLAWHTGGYLPTGLRVRKSTESAYSNLDERMEFSSSTPPPSKQDDAGAMESAEPPSKAEDAHNPSDIDPPKEEEEKDEEDPPEDSPPALPTLSFEGPPRTPEQIAEFKAYQIAKYQLQQQAPTSLSLPTPHCSNGSPGRKRSSTVGVHQRQDHDDVMDSDGDKPRRRRGRSGSSVSGKGLLSKGRRKYDSTYRDSKAGKSSSPTKTRRRRYLSSYVQSKAGGDGEAHSARASTKSTKTASTKSKRKHHKSSKSTGGTDASHLHSKLSTTSTTTTMKPSPSSPPSSKGGVATINLSRLPSAVSQEALDSLNEPVRPSPRGKSSEKGIQRYESVMSTISSIRSSGDNATLCNLQEETVAPSPRKTQTKRDMILTEILQTEYTYVMSLSMMDRIYYRPLLESKITPQPLIDGMFSDFEMIMGINKDFVKDLSMRVDGTVDDGTLCVGDLFLGFAPLLKMYTNYITNYDRAQKIVIQLRKDKSFASFIDSRMAAAGGLPLEAYLIMPVQRLPRYLLLLRELLSSTPEDHPDLALLEKALPIVTAQVEHVDKQKYDADIKIKKKLAKKVTRSDPELAPEKLAAAAGGYVRTTMIISVLEVRSLLGAKWKVSVEMMVNNPDPYSKGKWDKFGSRKVKVDGSTGVAAWENAELFSVPVNMSEEVRIAVVRGDGTVLGIHPCAASHLKTMFADHKEHEIAIAPVIELSTDAGKIECMHVVCEVDFIQLRRILPAQLPVGPQKKKKKNPPSLRAEGFFFSLTLPPPLCSGPMKILFLLFISSLFFLGGITGVFVGNDVLYPSNGTGASYFGNNVALSSDGTRALVSARRDDTAGNESGAVYVFDVNPSNASDWMEQAILYPSNGTGEPQFGWSLALSSDGTRALIGALGDDTVDINAGAAYVFDVNPSNASDWMLQTILYPSNGTGEPEFGNFLALSSDGTRAIIGAVGDDTVDINAGAAYVFDVNPSNASDWMLQTILYPSNGTGEPEFGDTVALSFDGSRALIGAVGDDTVDINAGAAYVFDVNPSNSSDWMEQAILYPTNGNGEPRFGNSLALSSYGSRALIGAWLDSTVDDDAGAMYVFDVNPSNSSDWMLQTIQYPSTTTIRPRFGTSVAISSDGGRVLIGATRDDTMGTNAGAAYVFTTIPTVISTNVTVSTQSPLLVNGNLTLSPNVTVQLVISSSDNAGPAIIVSGCADLAGSLSIVLEGDTGVRDEEETIEVVVIQYDEGLCDDGNTFDTIQVENDECAKVEDVKYGPSSLDVVVTLEETNEDGECDKGKKKGDDGWWQTAVLSVVLSVCAAMCCLVVCCVACAVMTIACVFMVTTEYIARRTLRKKVVRNWRDDA